MLNFLDSMLNSLNFLSDVTGMFSPLVKTIAAISLFIGIAFCLWGYKIIRVLFAICGIFLGGGAGALLCIYALKIANWSWIGAIIGAILGAILLFKLYQLGVFLLALSIGACIAGIFTGFTQDSLPIYLLIGVILGVLAVIWIRFAIIISTSLSGGSTAASGLAVLVGLSSNIIVLLISLALTIIGIIYQLKHTDKSYGKKPAAVAANAGTTTTTITITPATQFTPPIASVPTSAPSVTPAPTPIPVAEPEPAVVAAPMAEPEAPVAALPIDDLDATEVIMPTAYSEPVVATPPAEEPPAPTQQPTPPAAFCAACGAPLRQGAKFCGTCGTPNG